MTVLSLAERFDYARRVAIADWLAVAVAVSLPWSTSATSILIVVWIVAVIPTLTVADLRHVLATPAGGLPVLLVLLGALGMVWATDATWADGFGGLDGFLKLLVIPLLMAQFRRSERWRQFFTGFLFSCVALLAASFVVKLWPQLPRGSLDDGVAVKSYIVQSLEFAVCGAVLIHLAVVRAREERWLPAAGMLLLALAFLSDIAFIATGRTTLVILPVLMLVYGFKEFGWKGFVGAGLIGVALAGALWLSSPYLRERAGGVLTETERFENRGAVTSSGERIVFWTKSLRFVAEAPLIGHGTGSITPLFREAAVGHSGVRGEISTNPHNQTFAVGIQLGLLGVVALWAMWIAQIALFRGAGLVSWIGLTVVLANVVGSLFNSFIFDFTEGWIYIFGVGAAAGLALQQQDRGQKQKGRAQALQSSA